MKKINVAVLMAIAMACATLSVQAQTIKPKADKLLYCSAAFESASHSANDDTQGVLHFLSQRLANDARIELKAEGYSPSDIENTISAYNAQYVKNNALNAPAKYSPHDCEVAAGLNQSAG